MTIRVILKTKSDTIVIPLAVKAVYIGRSSSCNYQVEDETLSKKHCKLFILDGLATIKDLESKNGTILNNSLIAESHLYLGDKVKIGDCTLTLDKSSLNPHERKRHASRSISQHGNLRNITYKE